MPDISNTSSTKRVTMFAGKGGVGKTTCAGATALHHASSDGDTLVISTDPTPSLSHIFEMTDKAKPARVLDGLYLAELGQSEIRQMWDKKFGPEVYEVFSSFVAVDYDDFAEFVTSILPGLHDEFMVDYIKELSQTDTYRRIVWDTAPMGQTLGLLETPAMLREHLKPAPRIYSRLKLGSRSKRPVLDIIKGWEELSGEDMEFLRQGVSFVIVTIAEALAVEQLDSILEEMGRYGFRADQLVINNVIKEIGGSSFLQERADQQRGYIERLYRQYSEMKIVEVPLFSQEVKGLERLRKVAEHLFCGEEV
ncbi:MAG TPA: ArsA family ATPase [Dehalococcoidia bacterium]|nr:ArsA family ATPase [Dehalococcoidia bacterium]